MSYVTVATVKRYLRVIHSDDDTLLAELIEQAEDEALRFLNRVYPPTLPVDYPPESSSSEELSEEIPSSDDPVAPSFTRGVCLLVQAAYETPSPDEAAKMRANAETVLQPYRANMGP